jgi:hypothetical protein
MMRRADRQQGEVLKMKRVFYWAPRLVALAGIAFISLFALDAFGPGVSLADALLGFAIHMIPSAVLAVLLAVAWRFELVGGLAFLAISIVPFVGLSNPVWVNAILAAPFFLSGLLFVMSYFRRTSGSN